MNFDELDSHSIAFGIWSQDCWRLLKNLITWLCWTYINIDCMFWKTLFWTETFSSLLLFRIRFIATIFSDATNSWTSGIELGDLVPRFRLSQHFPVTAFGKLRNHLGACVPFWRRVYCLQFLDTRVYQVLFSLAKHVVSQECRSLSTQPLISTEGSGSNQSHKKGILSVVVWPRVASQKLSNCQCPIVRVLFK